MRRLGEGLLRLLLASAPAPLLPPVGVAEFKAAPPGGAGDCGICGEGGSLSRSTIRAKLRWRIAVRSSSRWCAARLAACPRSNACRRSASKRDNNASSSADWRGEDGRPLSSATIALKLVSNCR